ncbi:hypothetical protein [Streptomyces globosus]|uniref:hypothetical protein n=1 Tax=Streptomyces globosus TaxID=68209 RepID=UPI0036325F0D
MSRLTGWWKNRSSAAKVELYTRWSFHFFMAIEALVLLAALGTAPGPVAAVLVLPVLAHPVLCGVLSSRALDWVLGHRERPARQTAATAALTVVIVAALLALQSAGQTGEENATPMIVVNTVAFATGALSLALAKVRHMVLLPLAAAVLAGLPAAAVRPPRRLRGTRPASSSPASSSPSPAPSPPGSSRPSTSSTAPASSRPSSPSPRNASASAGTCTTSWAATSPSSP